MLTKEEERALNPTTSSRLTRKFKPLHSKKSHAEIYRAPNSIDSLPTGTTRRNIPYFFSGLDQFVKRLIRHKVPLPGYFEEIQQLHSTQTTQKQESKKIIPQLPAPAKAILAEKILALHRGIHENRTVADHRAILQRQPGDECINQEEDSEFHQRTGSAWRFHEKAFSMKPSQADL